MRAPLALAVVAGLAAAPSAHAAGGLTDAAARAFVASQEKAWNGRDLDGYFAKFTADAVFVDQTRTAKGEVIRYGDSSLSQAKTQSRRYFAKARFVDSRRRRQDHAGARRPQRAHPGTQGDPGGDRRPQTGALRPDRPDAGLVGRKHPLARPDRHHHPVSGASGEASVNIGLPRRVLSQTVEGEPAIS